VRSPGGDLEDAVRQLEPDGDGVERRRFRELGLAVVLGRQRAPEVRRALRCAQVSRIYLINIFLINQIKY
jgi:hypothetical protein